MRRSDARQPVRTLGARESRAGSAPVSIDRPPPQGNAVRGGCSSARPSVSFLCCSVPSIGAARTQNHAFRALGFVPVDPVGKRRTFAIISHPDAGKTTLTEKLLLYGGAIHLAGSVKARRASRHATSDWMAMEKERGISVTSSVLQFTYGGLRLNLLDTPGHQDFSEDTYRTLLAADSAVMLLDNRKGVEEQTRKLFDVCRLRTLPIFTFVNKCDRVGEDPLKLLDDVEADLGLPCTPITWPIIRGSDLLGVVERPNRTLHLFHRQGDHGQTRAGVHEVDFDSPEAAERLGDEIHDRVEEELYLLDAAAAPFDREEFFAGRVSPTFFGSALTNFGVEPFLRFFLEQAPAPPSRGTRQGERVDPRGDAFSGFVFKIQANMDPKHRDRLAFLRVCSGRFEPGMTVKNVRSGRSIRLAQPQQFLAQERQKLTEAWAGDVVGIHDRGDLRVGDTLSANGDIDFEGIPSFSPEHFARTIVADPLKRKHLDLGLRQLSEEGAVQLFYSDEVAGPQALVAVVGPLQFDVLLHRLEHEYGVPARLEPLAYKEARWVTGPEEEIRRLGRGYDRSLVRDQRERPVLLFRSPWARRQLEESEPEVTFHAVAPDV